jgi:murein DD-endopeptidase MepM/ murein hydrolase activator NlpD
VSIKALNATDALALSQMSEPNVESIRMSKDQLEAATAFESYMIEMMVKEMRKTVPDGMFSGGASEIFSGMFDQEISQRIAETGGFGFRDVMGQAMGVEHSASSAPSFMSISRPSASHGSHSRAVHDLNGQLPVDGVVTSHFGRRTDPFHGKKRAHKGLDIAAPTGTPIKPVREGTVLSAGKRGGFGNVVVVDHGDGVTSLYAHCDELKVNKGDKVRRGDTIATVGSTGRSTGPHLHLEIHRDGAAVDPISELRQKSHQTSTLARR